MGSKEEVWISCYHFHPVWSGPAERFLRYGPHFRQQQIEPVYYTIPRNRSQSDKNGFEVRFAGNADESIHGYFHALTKKALAKRPKGIIVLLADWKNAQDIRRLKKEGIPVIYVNTMVQKFSNSSFILKRLASNFLNLRYLKSYSKIVCSSTSLKKALLDFGLVKQKVEIIPNGVDMQRFKPFPAKQVKDLRHKYKLPVDKPLVLFVGLIVERKGVLELLRAWKKYKRQLGGEAALLLVGDEQRENKGFRSFYEEWDREEASLKESDEVFRFPPSADIQEFFQLSDLFAFLSKKEGMPNVLGEAMACKIPVLLTRFEGFSDSWGSAGKSYWVLENRAADKIAERIREILNNPVKMKEVAEMGRRHIAETQDVKKSIAKYISLIECAE